MFLNQLTQHAKEKEYDWQSPSRCPLGGFLWWGIQFLHQEWRCRKWVWGRWCPSDAGDEGENAGTSPHVLRGKSNIPYTPLHRRRGKPPLSAKPTQSRKPVGRAKALLCYKAPLFTRSDQFRMWRSRFLTFCFKFYPLYRQSLEDKEVGNVAHGEQI